MFFVGGAHPIEGAMSLADWMKHEFDALIRDARSGTTVESIAVGRSMSTSGNVREIAEVAAEHDLGSPITIVSPTTQGPRLERHAKRYGLLIQHIPVEQVLGPDCLPRQSRFAQVRRRLVRLSEVLDPNERILEQLVGWHRRWRWPRIPAPLRG